MSPLTKWILACFISGPVFGSKDQFSGLGIFFDTYANQNGPHNVSVLLSLLVKESALREAVFGAGN